MTPARAERAALVAAARTAGPDAPTLCGDWTVRDLLAHLVLRESRPDAAGGILIPALADRAERVRRGIAGRPFERLLDDVASGPPRLSPFRLLDEQLNLGEYFVHCEDIRRAGEGWSARELGPGVEAALVPVIRRMSRLTLRKAPVRVRLETERGTVAVVGSGAEVSVLGSPAEIALWVFGRDRAAVALHGDDPAIDRLAGFARSL